MNETAPKKRRAWLWLAVLTPLAAVGTVALLLALGVLFKASGETLEPTREERALLLDIWHLSSWMAGYTPDLSGERMTKTRYFDDSYEIEYVYDLPDDQAAPYLTYSLTFEGTEADARGTYTSIWGGTKVAFMMLGDTEVSVDERSELFQWGDFSRFGVLTTDGIPFRQRLSRAARKPGRLPSSRRRLFRRRPIHIGASDALPRKARQAQRR